MSFIGIDVTGNKEIADLLEKIPAEAGGAGVEAANEYIVEFEKHYPPRVEHGPGNPYKWSSDRQRRWYFANYSNAPYSRSQRLANGWKTLGEGISQIVVNEMPYAQFVKDWQQQIGHMYDGWNIIATDVKDNMAQIVRKFESGVSKGLKKLGLQK